ncbi:EamA family transporter [Rhodosalinus halophilus]|uniref:EamA family transporter n=2 Tax=Rhodosalinus halophilus TaxID=2259333 RepID=A0A365UC73_9RHOB|nr:EamA family transporter [Rhodosalinus halophilus]
MLVTGLCFVAVTALVKYLGDRVPAPQSAFLRYLLGLVFLLPVLRPLLRARPTRRQHLLFGGRGLLHAVGVMLWFYAMTRIPLAEVTAMNYLSPVYVTVGAALFLGERLAIRRIAAVAAALVGALVILRPGFRELDPGHLAMLGTAAVFGGSYLLAKVVSDETDPALVVAMLSVWVTLWLVPAAAAVWITPTPWELAVLLAVAFFATAGHYTMSLAFRAAPVTVTQPVTFLQLVWAVILGAVAFGEAVDPFVVAGGLIIIAAVSFITWREAVLKRRSITPAGPETKG